MTQIGDKVRVPGRFGTDHYGIVVSGGMVVHACKEAGRVVRDPFASFAKGQAITIVQRAQPGFEGEVARRAETWLGRPYDLVAFNCEHLASYASSGVAASPQLQRGLVATGALLAMVSCLRVNRDWDSDVSRYRGSDGRFKSGWR